MRAALVALAAIAGLTAAAPAAAVAAPLRPPENPEGATIAVATTTVGAGDPVAFAGTGFVRTGGGGQVVTVKLDDDRILGTFTADATGAVAGQVPAPSAPGEHWLRFLAGSGGTSGTSGEPPARSLIGDFAVAAPVAAVTPSAASGATALQVGALTVGASGRSATLALDCPAALTAGCRGSVVVRSTAKVRGRVITAARAAYVLGAGQAGTLTLRLAKAARAVLDDRGRLATRVTVARAGAASVVVRRTLGG
jgi:hypothetical protein